jgi:CRISPR system Cascade subunit CasE
MTYLSWIWLNPLRTATQRMLRNPQVLHAATLGGLSVQPVRERVLWRLEADSAHRLHLLVLTRSSPSWEHLVEQAGWPAAEQPQALVRGYESLLERVERGREFAFRLRANPVSATKNLDKPSTAQAERIGHPRPRGVRVPHRTAAYQLAWLQDRIHRWGFELAATGDGNPDVILVARDRLAFAKNRGDRCRITLSTATYQGRLRVADPEAACRSLLDGVGPARAYGCGLITLAPVTPGSASPSIPTGTAAASTGQA